MAQAAHFTTTSQNRPSIFEVIAQNSLNETLHPALQRVAIFLADNFANKFLWLSEYYDETFLGFNLLLQLYYLRKHDASFSENFYGLKRVSLSSTEALNGKEKQISLLVIAIFPYVKRKLEEKINNYRIQKAEGSLRNNVKDSLKKFLIHLHSACHFSWGVWTVTNYVRYMSRKTNAQQPILWAINQQLVYSNEINEINFWSALFKGELNFSDFVKNAMGALLEATAFFMQFLQAWNAERPNFNLNALPVVGPPKLHERAKESSKKCPICMQNWKIPTVLPASGFVFCFPCILRHLRENQRCPVTSIPAKPLDIIRLYDN